MRALWVVVAAGLAILFGWFRAEEPMPAPEAARLLAVDETGSSAVTAAPAPANPPARLRLDTVVPTVKATAGHERAAEPLPLVLLVRDADGRPLASAVATRLGTFTDDVSFADAEGRVAIPIPPPGGVLVRAAGFASIEVPVHDYKGPAATIVVLPPAATLVVRVIDDLGRLLPDMQVTAELTPRLPGAPRFADMLWEQTDDTGCATFTQSGGATYQVRVQTFGRWRTPPLTMVTAVAGQRTVVDVTVPTHPVDHCLELVAPDLEATPFPERIHPRFAFQIDGEAALVRIHRPGTATYIGSPGQQIRVRIVATNQHGTADLFEPAWPWQSGVVGQPRPLQFLRPH
jgi:hypothetical protein